MNDPNPIIKWENGQGRISDVSINRRSVILVLILFPLATPRRWTGMQRKVRDFPHLDCSRATRVRTRSFLPVFSHAIDRGGNDIYTAIKQ